MRALVIVMAAAAPTGALASPNVLTHAGRLLDAAGGGLNGDLDVTISVYSGPDGAATRLWTETETVAFADGYYNVVLGDGTAFPPTLFDGSTRYLDIAIEGVLVSPRQAIYGTPYAQHATTAQTASGVTVGDVTVDACSAPGQILYDNNAKNLFVCSGSAWLAVGGTTIIDIGGSRRWSDDTVAQSCEHYIRPTTAGYRYAGTTGDGLYRIDPDGSGGTPALDAWCDMTNDEGGWTLVASVRTWSNFWDQNQYNSGNSARSISIGTPSPDANYVMHLESWRDLLAAQGSASELRLRVRRGDNGQEINLGFLEGLQMLTNGRFTNPTAAYYGDHTPFSGAVTDACVIQYSSNFEGSVVNTYFHSGDPAACTGWMGWNGACGYPSLGHNGHYYQTSSSPTTPMFSHACSTTLQYYCSANHVDGPPSNSAGCNYRAKWYWIR